MTNMPKKHMRENTTPLTKGEEKTGWFIDPQKTPSRPKSLMRSLKQLKFQKKTLSALYNIKVQE